MQGLVHYSDDSSPEPSPQSGPSRLRDGVSTASPSGFFRSNPNPKPKPPSGVVLTKVNSPKPGSVPRAPKRRRVSPPPPALPVSELRQAPSSAGHSPAGRPLPENLTHTAQVEIPSSELAVVATMNDAGREVLDRASLEGLDEEEILKMVTMPKEIDGVANWGIPPEVDPSQCDEKLTAKVEHFLKLKYERHEHINSRLMSSSAFANPHIYSKLVDFVSISERASAFPPPLSTPASSSEDTPGPSKSRGWLTRQNLESLIPAYGPDALNAAQKKKQEDLLARQAPGTRREIAFAKGKKSDTAGSREREREREKERERERGRDRGKGRDRPRGERERDWDRDRKPYRR